MTTEIFKCVAGSRLFGTATATSDTDFKAVHLPTKRSVLLQTADAVTDRSTGSKDSANGPDDVDLVSYPLIKFLSMLSGMETNALEMLHASNMHGRNYIWNDLYQARFRFMSANKDGFTGFGKSQAMRYAVRGDRLETLTKVCDVLAAANQSQPALLVKDQLAQVPNVVFTDYLQAAGNLTPFMTVFGRSVALTVKASEALTIYQRPIKEAGKRSLAAQAVGGADWKGLYHALRVVDEGTELFTTGGLVFPLRHAPLYKEVRSGSMSLERVLDIFEEKLVELEFTTPISDFREKPDMNAVNTFIELVHEVVVRNDLTEPARRAA